MNLEQYINSFAKAEGMNITPEATQKMTSAITDYITKITQKTISLGMHKTLMADDLDIAMTLIKWEEIEIWYEEGGYKWIC